MANFVTNTSDKSKKTALWLCILGGIFGLHHFLCREDWQRLRLLLHRGIILLRLVC